MKLNRILGLEICAARGVFFGSGMCVLSAGAMEVNQKPFPSLATLCTIRLAQTFSREEGVPDTVQQLLETVPVNIQQRNDPAVCQSLASLIKGRVACLCSKHPLVAAAGKGDLDLVSCFIRRGLHLNERDMALRRAALKNKPRVMQVLIGIGQTSADALHGQFLDLATRFG